MLRPVLYVLLALGSFLGVGSLFQQLVPWPEGLGLGVKMEVLREHGDEYDAIFIGSSRVVRGLDNRIVDERLREAGIEFYSFNAAVGGCRVFEQDFILHEVLALQPAKLKWIFIEGGPVGMGLREDHIFRDPPNLWTSRGVFWHTPAETRRLLGAITRLPLSVWQRAGLAATHLQLMGWRLANYGKGEKVINWMSRSSEALNERDAILSAVHESQGHRGLESVTGRESSIEMDELLRDPTDFLGQMRAIASENEEVIEGSEINVGIHREQLAAAAAAGIRLVYFIPPGFEGSPERLRLGEGGEIPELLHFNDPERYPELFQLDHRFDQGHLNRRGVELWSAAFADQLIDLIQREQGD